MTDLSLLQRKPWSPHISSSWGYGRVYPLFSHMWSALHSPVLPWLSHIARTIPLQRCTGPKHKTMLVACGRGEDGTEFSPFASVLGAAEAERCQAGHVALPAPSVPISDRMVKYWNALKCVTSGFRSPPLRSRLRKSLPYRIQPDPDSTAQYKNKEESFQKMQPP